MTGSSLISRSALAAAILLAGAGAVLWAKFGSTVFVDLLAMTLTCF